MVRWVFLCLVLCGILLLLHACLSGESNLHSGQTVRVYNTETQELMTMDLEEYLVGVVSAEMPASFHMEALKAQAIAARTFAISRMQHPSPKVTALHKDAQLSTSPETCQAWIGEETQRNRWGDQYTKYHKKIVRAVAETAGEVLCYEGTLIEPLYHASCGGGLTEAAVDVWGNEKPYLVSVACNHPDDPHTQQTVTMSLQEMRQRLGIGTTAGSTTIQLLSSTASNRVKTVRIGEKQFTGIQVRNLLGLKSTLFRWDIHGTQVTFTTNGYGHGVGMCQYGADYYGAQGQSYRQILQRYYPGTEITKI